MTANFRLLDCTLREGLQAIDPVRGDRGVVFTFQQCIAIAELLIDFKVDFLELGSPIQSKQTSELITRVLELAQNTKTQINLHCRLHETDLQAALALRPHGYNFYYNLSRTANPSEHEAVSEKIIDFSKRIKLQDSSATVRFSFENSFKTDYEIIKKVTNAVHEFVDRIGLPDTSGGIRPTLVRRRLLQFRRDYPDVPLELHFHNDFGLAAANAFEAMRVKNTIIHTTILGIGERNGIVATSQAIALGMISPRSAKRLIAEYDVTKLQVMDEYVAGLLKMPIPQSMPITSAGYFCHSAGVHVNGQSLNKRRYQLLESDLFGKESSNCWASAVVGKANIQCRAKELGIAMSATDAQELAAHIREKAKKNGGISPKVVDKKIQTYSVRK